MAQSTEPTVHKTILVTGGAGYIGSHTVLNLRQHGYSVVVIDNLSTGQRSFVPDDVVFIEGDAGDIGLLRSVFSSYHIDAVMHFAASLEVEESVAVPVPYLENNLGTTLRLLAAMAEAGVTSIILSSTGAVYGDQVKMPIAETASLQPTNPYGQSKILCEQALEYYAKWVGFSATVLRYFNVCGAEPSGKLGDTHINSHLIPIVLEVAQGKREKLIINGSDYDTFDGTCVRDYIHVMDIAEAHRLALENLGTPGLSTFNVGTGKGYSVEEITRAAAEVLNRMIQIEMGPRRAGDPPIAVADTQKIRTKLGFVPQYSDLETIIKTTWHRMQ
jgi:UDP-glucose 4-epimerase